MKNMLNKGQTSDEIISSVRKHQQFPANILGVSNSLYENIDSFHQISWLFFIPLHTYTILP